MARSLFSALSSLGPFSAILSVLREVDVRPARIAAETPFLIAFVSRDAQFAEHLAALMYRGDRPTDTPPYRAAIGAPITDAAPISRANVVVIVTRDTPQLLDEALRLKRALEASDVPVLMCFVQERGAPPPAQSVTSGHAVTLPLDNGALDEQTAIERLTAAIRQLNAIDDLALARHLPAFRAPVVRALIEDVATANATYSLGSGLLQINPATGLPVAVADTVILTKNQAIMAYKIALAMGLPADFKHIMPQIAGVIGGGLILRQVARLAIGWLPGLGIAPKVAIAFAGTFAIGEAVYRWSRSGERLTEDGLKAIYALALERGKALAAGLRQRRVSRPAKAKANPSEQAMIALPPSPSHNGAARPH
ncbi:MAG: hypothetical protein D6709_01170 [Chloroflexi bacterium]|jgi:uncharacterized protein (DUF697 family)|uniref:DUF697 domain-containing protein n=1 Tax=Candidatus Thermofonsia Clade 3 bacterium TaxID=2364212 RepID=A0A2M8QC47_9CHLR|nr:hypothetical protein [Candidatus Roseilinea sp. NK_OTU-006]PJF47376.1 MAG: hypothetical protein CUN48_09015 [Candidatus Thermofonsia Clade 3 bacterium]RMG65945.1 MAG: hypothetical protein D6709_01170 [Chloroflexota bacterium]